MPTIIKELPARADLLRILCERAGAEVLAIRKEGELGVRVKADASPVSLADMAAHRHLVDGLTALDSTLPILSEEQASICWPERACWSRYWLVDPLDGTREFIAGYPDFTVNVALIEDGKATFGVVHAPAWGVSWLGGAAVGAWRCKAGRYERISAVEQWPPRVLVSRSHLDSQTQAWVNQLPSPRLQQSGSSLKFCRLAEGGGDLYPRFAPTAEWDTAAAQAVLEGAGGAVLDTVLLQPLRYNRGESLLNGSFIACANPQGRWREYPFIRGAVCGAASLN